MIRLPAVAGRFYAEEPETLARSVAEFCAPSDELTAGLASALPKQVPAIACLVPHAGYRYSGRVAGAVYGRIKLPRRFLLLGPRHYPQGRELAILSEGSWQTPLGRAEIDGTLAAELKAACPLLAEDEVAHRKEHALEVQLPFLQCLAEGFQFVPIALGTMNLGALDALGRAIAAVMARQTEPVLIVASSDMNHYESDEITRRKDGLALERLLSLDPRGLHGVVQREGITMCGCGPAVSMLTAALRLGAKRAKLVQYATSGDTSGDYDEVVGYAGIIVD